MPFLMGQMQISKIEKLILQRVFFKVQNHYTNQKIFVAMINVVWPIAVTPVRVEDQST